MPNQIRPRVQFDSDLAFQDLRRALVKEPARLRAHSKLHVLHHQGSSSSLGWPKVVSSYAIGDKSCVVVTSGSDYNPCGDQSWSLMDMHSVLFSHVRTMHGVSHRRRRLSFGAGSKVNASATPVGYRSVPRLVCEWLISLHDLTSYMPANCSKKQAENSMKDSRGRLTHVHLTICEIEHIAA